MSVCDQQAATSFGDPNARPPTPRTPTAVFSSPVFQTPKQLSSHHFDETSGRTPRFAEEYSVFNSTPGNFRRVSSPGSDASNLDFVPVSPVAAPSATGRKRPLSAEVAAVEIAAHANHFTADPANLAPVDPARRLPSSSDPLAFSHKDAATKVSQAQGQQSRAQQQGRRLAKKPRGASVSGTVPKSPPRPTAEGQQGQTATPPPSSRGGRKLAPKPQMDNMQDQGFPQPDFLGAPPPPQLDTTFVTGNPENVFSYQVGPATAPPITGPRPFWGLDMDASGMSSGATMAIDVDLSAAGVDIFQTGSAQDHAHGQMNSIGWGRADQMFQQQQQEMTVPADRADHYPQQSHSHAQQPSKGQNVQPHATPRRERPLAPKTASMSTPGLSQQSPSQNFLNSFQMLDNPFSVSPGGVDPGLLFSQPTTSAPLDHSMMSMSMDTATSQHPTSSAPAIMATDPNAMEAPLRGDNNKSAPPTDSKDASKGQQRKKLGRAPAISSAKKSDGRPILSRSFSESARGGKRSAGGGRNPLPVLAPARPVTNRQPNLPSQAASQGSSSRVQAAPGGRPGGRSSPLKSSHHHRLSSLTSIPENTANVPARPSSAKRTSVKFVIDENGRAHAETVVDGEDDDEQLQADPLATSQQIGHRNSWGGFLPLPASSPDSDVNCSSSSDDEPIIIPSRNPSFAFPDPRRGSSSGNSRPPTASSIFSQTRIQRRSFSDRPSTASFRREEAEAMEAQAPTPSSQPPQRPSTGGSLSDAAAELRKVMQAVNPRRLSSGQQPPALGSGGRLQFPPGPRSSSSTISEASLPGASPTQGREQSQVRCVCNRPEAGEGAFLVKCHSCEYLLHGRCVDMATPHDVPHVYICAFCANTPNMRGGRMRHTGRANAGAAGGGASSRMGPPVSSAAAAAAAAVAASSPLAHKSGRSFR